MSAERGQLIEELITADPGNPAGFAQCGLNLAGDLMPEVNIRPVLAETAVANAPLFFHQVRCFGYSVRVVDQCVKRGVLTSEMADKIMAETSFSLIHDTGKMGIEEGGIYQSLDKMNGEPANKTDSRSSELKALHASHVPIGAAMWLSVGGLAGGLIHRGIHRHHETLVKPRSARGGKISYSREFLRDPTPGALLAPAVDIFDAMSHKRPYQNGNPMPEACEIEAEMAGVMPNDAEVNLSVFGTNKKDVCAVFRECLVEIAEQVRPYYGEPDPNPAHLRWGDSPLIQEKDKRLDNLNAAVKFVWKNYSQHIEEYKVRIRERYEKLSVDERGSAQ